MAELGISLEVQGVSSCAPPRESKCPRFSLAGLNSERRQGRKMLMPYDAQDIMPSVGYIRDLRRVVPGWGVFPRPIHWNLPMGEVAHVFVGCGGGVGWSECWFAMACRLHEVDRVEKFSLCIWKFSIVLVRTMLAWLWGEAWGRALHSSIETNTFVTSLLR